MPNPLEPLRLFVMGLAVVWPAMVGLVVLGVGLRVVPKKLHLAYGVVGLTVLIFICQRIHAAHPNPGPDFGVISSGLFVLVATPLVLGLTCVWVFRLLRARRTRTGPDAAT